MEYKKQLNEIDAIETKAIKVPIERSIQEYREVLAIIIARERIGVRSGI